MTAPPRKRRWRRLGLGALGLLLAMTLIGAISTSGCAGLGALRYGSHRARMQASPEWHEGHFENPQATEVMPSAKTGSVLREWWSGTQQREPPGPLPLFEHTREVLQRPPASGLRLTWFGHSSTLIEIDGVRLLTDPQWSERASPVAFAGPKRFHPPVVPLEALGHLDAVLISHDHYDHLDQHTVQTLAPTGVRFIVPLGIGGHLESWGVPQAQITELDWWQDAAVGSGLHAVSVPAHHFSGRFLSRNPTLWTSWALVGPGHRVFFSGDTGLHAALSEIAAREGPFDVAMLEIGQYHPAWGDSHLGAEGALQAFAQLGAKQLLPIHWSTFELALHGWCEPAEEVVVAAPARHVEVLTPLLGEPIEPSEWKPREPWWHQVHGP